MTSSGWRGAWRGAGLAAIAGLAACGGPGETAGEPTGQVSEPVQQCETAVVEGVDVYDGTGTIDWAKVKGAGVDFAIMKATQGTYNTQKTFPTNWAGAKAAGVYRSAYHFFDPTEDGTAQAQHFLAVVGTIGPGDLPAMLDIECPDGDKNCLGTGSSGAAAASDIKTRIWDFVHAVETATGKKPILYTFGSYFSSNGVDTTGLDAYPLYIADITPGTCFNVPSPWTTAIMWQYSWTGTVAGITGQVDRDRFIGTLAGLGMLGQGGGPADAGAHRDGGRSDGGGSGSDASAQTPDGAVAEAGDDGAGAGGVDAAGVDAPAASGAASGGSSGCSCDLGRTASVAPGPWALLLAVGALRRRRGRAR